MKRDCMNCKHCILRPMAYGDGVTNTCEFQNKIESLSSEEMMERIVTNECAWMEEGTPKVSDTVCYDD